MTSDRNVKQPVTSAKDPLDTLLHQHDPHARRWTRSSRRTPGIRARRWPWRRWPTASGRTTCGTIPRIRVWPNRDRFVLSAGHASMLLYSLLHLAGVKAVNKDYETLGDAGRLARRHQEVPAVAQQVPGPSRVPPDLGRRDDDRAAGAGRCATASAWRWPSAGWRPTSTSPASRPVRLQRLRHLQRRRHDGGHLARGRLAGRAPASCRTSAGSTTTTTSRSRARPTWPSARTSAERFMGYGWNVTRVGDANDLELLRAGVHRRSWRPTTGRP